MPIAFTRNEAPEHDSKEPIRSCNKAILPLRCLKTIWLRRELISRYIVLINRKKNAYDSAELEIEKATDLGASVMLKELHRKSISKTQKGATLTMVN